MRPSLAIIGSLPLLLLLLLSPTVIASNATSTSTTTAVVVADPQDPERKHNSGTNNDYCEDYRQRRRRRRTQLEDRDEGSGGENYIYGSGGLSSSEPIDDSNIEIAVGLWLNNRTAALERFGFIQFWDVLGVTSMRNLFRDATAFNDNIAAWNVDCVTNFHGMFWGYV